MSFSLWAIAIIAMIIFALVSLFFLVSRYRRCPSDKVLVVFGRVGTNKSAKTVHGGGTFVWPVIQDYTYLSLTPMTIGIPLQNALSYQNIRIHVPSTFTVGISTDPPIMTNAAERLLGLTPKLIEDMAQEIIFGQLRLTVASLTIEQINQDRESFLESIRHNVEPELNKIGLYLINVNITDITDGSDYINSIGKKAAAEAINKARIDVSIQEKSGAIGEAEAIRERDIRVAENLASAEKGKKSAEADQRIFVQQREADAVSGENTSKAQIADSNAELAKKQAEAKQISEVALREAEVNIQRAQYKAEAERLKASEIVNEEISKQKVEISAEAEAQKIRRIAKGQADSILMKYEAEAEGMRKLLQAKADGYKGLIDSCDGDSKAAATMLMIEKLEEIIKLQVEAIKNIKIDKITVWDSGNGKDGSSTSNFMSSLIKTLPPLQEIASMAGVELPEYLGKLKPDSVTENNSVSNS